MDSLTQIVLGGAVGEAVLGKKVGNKAILWGAVAGTIPDLDVFLRMVTENIVYAQEMHRGFSHSIVFSVLMTPLLGWLMAWIHRKGGVGWKSWSKLAFWSLITHPLLDCHTNYGTQLFWPFEYRVSYQNIFVADPLYTVPFLICLIIVMRHRRNPEKRVFYNKLGLIISSSYMVLTIGLKGIAHYRFTNQLAQQHIEYLEVDTNPTPFNAILWSATVETEDEILVGLTSMFDSDTHIEYHHILKNRELLGDMAEEDLVKRLIRLSRGWYAVEEGEDGIYFYDLRFGMFDDKQSLRELPFGYVLYYEDGVLNVKQKSMGDFDMGGALAKLFDRMWGK